MPAPSALLPLLLASAVLLQVAASQNHYKCVEKSNKGVMYGETEKLNFKLPAYQKVFVTSLPHRIGVRINGVSVKACGINESNILLGSYWLVVERGPGPTWMPVKLAVTRHFSPVAAPTTNPAPLLSE